MRLLSVVAALASLIFVISTVLLMPSYVTLQVEKNRLSAEDATLSESIKEQNAKGFAQTLFAIKSMVASAAPDQTRIFEALNVSEKVKPEGVKFSDLIYSHSTDASSTIAISGVAASRSDLIVFVDDLKKQKEFASVDLPVSNLAKESDVKFTINLKGNF